MYTVGVPLETMAGERRVALCPDSVHALIGAGFAVRIERGAGRAAGCPDDAYLARGATVARCRASLLDGCDVLAQVNTWPADPHARGDELTGLVAGQVVVGLADPLRAPERIAQLAGRGVTAFGLELLPRIPRAEDMDVLASMATLTGYRATIVAADRLPRCFPMFMTATGMVRPARVLVLGAGVTGLQAIATARGLGAVVRAHDPRPGVRAQVERAGAAFIALDLGDVGDCPTTASAAFHRQQHALLAQLVATSDVVIATVPAGGASPLIDGAMVQGMEPGSVIVDLAAARGGACALSRADAEVIQHGVTILGPSNLAAQVPHHASRLYSHNLTAFLRHAVRATDRFDLSDEIVCGTLLCRDGTVVHPQVRRRLGLAPLEPLT